MWPYIASFFGVLVAAGLLFQVKHVTPQPQYLDQYHRPITEAQFNALIAESAAHKARIAGYVLARQKEIEEEDRKRGTARPETAVALPNEGLRATDFYARSVPRRDPVANPPRCAENGSCYGDISYRTNLPKHDYVPAYYRKNGTRVRGHYKSHR